MPDYNRKATLYWWSMVALGSGLLGHALWEMHTMPLSVLPQLLAGTALAVLAGFFPVRIPGSKNSFVAGENHRRRRRGLRRLVALVQTLDQPHRQPHLRRPGDGHRRPHDGVGARTRRPARCG